jgi:cytochrome c oxidase cbb3-type subunit III
MSLFCKTLRLFILALVFPAYTSSAVEISTDALESGRKIYNYRCYYCHGYSGNAKTLAARFMVPPPRDFTQTTLSSLTRDDMLLAVTKGRDKTAMTSFTKFLSEQDIALVVDFIRYEFISKGLENTRYHTKENGWDGHEKYEIAFPFATGEIALDTAQEKLTAQQRAGLQLYLTSCITCHDNSNVNDYGGIWQSQAISYPRNNYSFTHFDGVTGASTYQKHDTFALLDSSSVKVKQGEALFRNNCAFCHALDGSGQNWIGSFLAKKPQNLQSSTFISDVNKEELMIMIKKGKMNTSMPAWESVLSDNQIEAIISYIYEAFH